MIAKGKLTKLSAALYAAAQTPNALADTLSIADTFANAAETPLSIVSLVAAAGVIWGGIRRAFDYFGK
jgi:hypothetical protein